MALVYSKSSGCLLSKTPRYRYEYKNWYRGQNCNSSFLKNQVTYIIIQVSHPICCYHTFAFSFQNKVYFSILKCKFNKISTIYEVSYNKICSKLRITIYIILLTKTTWKSPKGKRITYTTIGNEKLALQKYPCSRRCQYQYGILLTWVL